jgi:hypothetical protein
MVVAKQVSAMPQLIIRILLGGSPPQIRQFRIGSDSIQVSALHTGRAWATERQ